MLYAFAYTVGCSGPLLAGFGLSSSLPAAPATRPLPLTVDADTGCFSSTGSPARFYSYASVATPDCSEAPANAVALAIMGAPSSPSTCPMLASASASAADATADPSPTAGSRGRLLPVRYATRAADEPPDLLVTPAPACDQEWPLEASQLVSPLVASAALPT